MAAKGHIITRTNDIARVKEQTDMEKLSKELAQIYEDHIMSADQQLEIHKLRLEFTEKQRELLHEYMLKEREVAVRNFETTK